MKLSLTKPISSLSEYICISLLSIISCMKGVIIWLDLAIELNRHFLENDRSIFSVALNQVIISLCRINMDQFSV